MEGRKRERERGKESGFSTPMALRCIVVTVKVSADIDARSVTIDFESSDELKNFIDGAKANQGFLIPVSGRPEPFSSFSFKLCASEDFAIDFEARLLQFLEPAGQRQGAFQLSNWDAAKDQELARKITESGRAEDASNENETRGTSPVHRIQKMDPGTRARLALKADRAERQILCRDSTPQVLLNMLSNPRIEAQNVLSIVKSTTANAGLLERISKDRRWMSNPEILTAVVRNPKTPTPIAIRLLENVPTRELRDMAKMGALRENVRRAAFRIYTKRQSRR